MDELRTDHIYIISAENSTSEQSIQILLLPTVFHALIVPLNKMHPMTLEEAVQLYLGINC